MLCCAVLGLGIARLDQARACCVMLRYAVLYYVAAMLCHTKRSGVCPSPVMIGYSHTKQACFGNIPPLVEDGCPVTQ